MTTKNCFKLAAIGIALSCLFISCNNEKQADAVVAGVSQEAARPDMGKIKTDIQALETAWAAADNARDVKALAAFYADDAISLSNNKSMASGKAAIEKDLEEMIAKREKGGTVAYDVLDVYGDENTVTEVGKTTSKDSTGKVTYTGKYMAIWQKRDGKWICVRDISNDDAPAKKD